MGLTWQDIFELESQRVEALRLVEMWCAEEEASLLYMSDRPFRRKGPILQSVSVVSWRIF